MLLQTIPSWPLFPRQAHRGTIHRRLALIGLYCAAIAVSVEIVRQVDHKARVSPRRLFPDRRGFQNDYPVIFAQLVEPTSRMQSGPASADDQPVSG